MQALIWLKSKKFSENPVGFLNKLETIILLNTEHKARSSLQESELSEEVTRLASCGRSQKDLVTLANAE